jgi:hypothetical protein
VGRTVRALGVDGPRAFEVYFKSEVFGKDFREKIASGQTVRGSTVNSPKLTLIHTERCTTRELRADCPRGPGRRSARSWRTIRLVQRATLTAVDFAFLPLEFKCGQSVRALRTVREVRVFDITACNGKGSINTPSPGWETLSWHFIRFILHCRALPLLCLTHFA